MPSSTEVMMPITVVKWARDLFPRQIGRVLRSDWLVVKPKMPCLFRFTFHFHVIERLRLKRLKTALIQLRRCALLCRYLTQPAPWC